MFSNFLSAVLAMGNIQQFTAVIYSSGYYFELRSGFSLPKRALDDIDLLNSFLKFKFYSESHNRRMFLLCFREYSFWRFCFWVAQMNDNQLFLWNVKWKDWLIVFIKNTDAGKIRLSNIKHWVKHFHKCSVESK